MTKFPPKYFLRVYLLRTKIFSDNNHSVITKIWKFIILFSNTQ